MFNRFYVYKPPVVITLCLLIIESRSTQSKLIPFGRCYRDKIGGTSSNVKHVMYHLNTETEVSEFRYNMNT